MTDILLALSGGTVALAALLGLLHCLDVVADTIERESREK